jgi:hypothetical protein
MKLRPMFNFFGGKWRTTPKYPEPVYSTIIEPFAGSAGYSHHYWTKRIVLYEIDPVIAGLWNYLIQVKEDEIRSLPIHITDLREMGLTQEQRWLIGFWVNRGTTSPRNKPSVRAKRKTGRWARPKSHWGPTIKFLIASQLKYIRHWKIHNESYKNAPSIEATWFVDPPYVEAGKHYKFHDIDYPALSQWCRNRKGQVIVCEAPGADWLPFRRFTIAKTNIGKQIDHKFAEELVWTKCDRSVGLGIPAPKVRAV